MDWNVPLPDEKEKPLNYWNDSIEKWLDKIGDKYEVNILSRNKDGVMVEMFDIVSDNKKSLFYMFMNPQNGEIQLSSLSGKRRSWNDLEQLIEDIYR